MEAHRLAAWRDEFLAGGMKSEGQTPATRGTPAEGGRAKVGELTMENEVLKAVARKRGFQIPPGRRPRWRHGRAADPSMPATGAPLHGLRQVGSSGKPSPAPGVVRGW